MFAVSYGRCLEEKDSVCESQHVVPAGPDSVVVEPCQVNFSPPAQELPCRGWTSDSLPPRVVIA